MDNVYNVVLQQDAACARSIVTEGNQSDAIVKLFSVGTGVLTIKHIDQLDITYRVWSE
jgi:hypothetical protein